jgi:hypothetical protein
MKRLFLGSVFTAVLLAASAGSARAQDEALLQYGVRASVIMHSVYELDDENNHHYNPGFGFGAGLLLRHIVSDELSLRGEPTFYWRTLYNYESGSIYVNEMALCIPLTANYYISSDKIYLSGGLEFDLPFNTQRFVNSNALNIGDDRSYVDVGFLVGGGYMVADNIGVDARYVIYFNNPRKRFSELLMSYGIGVFMFF